MSSITYEWKHLDHAQNMKGSNPKPLADDFVQSWVLDSYRSVSYSNIRTSITSAGYSNDFKQLRTAMHTAYGSISQASGNSGNVENFPRNMEAIPQEDDEHKKKIRSITYLDKI